MVPSPQTAAGREQRRREIARRETRAMGATVLRMLVYAVFICLAAYACAFLAFLVFA